MFLKTESFDHNGATVTLSELSALQRIEHLGWLKERENRAGARGNLQVTVEDLIKEGAFLVAMSLWRNHPQKDTLTVQQLCQEVISSWPVEAISSAQNVVLRLSGMSAPVSDDDSGLAEEAEPAESVSAGKHSKAS
ncbi:phage minor tail protein G [Salmonella enterica]|uniref:Phage minor tail protein G n=1 Tax=Salmonella enterica subsp. enterica serovar Poona TaxID=436295 RepID=A0A5V6NKM2_SALET|nr:phage minor tail protein G [Salmonella enterica subsp. enterica serovar Oranienburg]EAN0330412.1 phage minor tail protein G [Salmonella enterica]EBH8586972.1 phage minor tail protein G [Salmonella enterica subsp. enterica serovar Pomona]EBS4388067.1 phage minor tail protein G [Salmonella enterica subsp. enterica serovar Panama]EBS4765759.1 phage minor tail protein G [Salmonella enterica subsp. enterica serovar Poona]ECI0430266.1 phage minor tail protein G [Salmonella enterica subsp. enteric